MAFSATSKGHGEGVGAPRHYSQRNRRGAQHSVCPALSATHNSMPRRKTQSLSDVKFEKLYNLNESEVLSATINAAPLVNKTVTFDEVKKDIGKMAFAFASLPENDIGKRLSLRDLRFAEQIWERSKKKKNTDKEFENSYYKGRPYAIDAATLLAMKLSIGDMNYARGLQIPDASKMSEDMAKNICKCLQSISAQWGSVADKLLLISEIYHCGGSQHADPFSFHYRGTGNAWMTSNFNFAVAATMAAHHLDQWRAICNCFQVYTPKKFWGLHNCITSGRYNQGGLVDFATISRPNERDSDGEKSTEYLVIEDFPYSTALNTSGSSLLLQCPLVDPNRLDLGLPIHIFGDGFELVNKAIHHKVVKDLYDLCKILRLDQSFGRYELLSLLRWCTIVHHLASACLEKAEKGVSNLPGTDASGVDCEGDAGDSEDSLCKNLSNLSVF